MSRSRTTLLDQLSIMEPTNLRDLLNFRQDLNPSAAVASDTRGGRTLLDIILQENEAEASGGGGGIVPEADEGRDVGVSLMTLLALTERVGGKEAADGGGGVAVVAVTEDEEAAAAAAAAVERAVCCVCLARRRGAAFIPCGHTFCRACSRELWTGRGSCPLCNGVILDILDIF